MSDTKTCPACGGTRMRGKRIEVAGMVAFLDSACDVCNETGRVPITDPDEGKSWHSVFDEAPPAND